MALYKFLQSYRGINKMKTAGQTKHPEFFNFHKEDVVEAEDYTVKNVQGVKFSKMMIVAGEYIVPAKVLQAVENNEVSESLEDKTSKSIDLNNIDGNKADILEGKTVKSIISNSANVGKGAVIGGIAGFGAAYLLKKNRWLGVLVGVLVGTSVALIYNHNKKAKEAELKEETETEKTDTNE